MGSDELHAVIGSVNKQFKRNVIKPAAEASNPFLLRRPTGIASLDLAISGGFPAGGVCQIAAPAGVGKNAMCNRTLAMCQQIYGDDATVFWCWTELSYDKKHAQINGVVVPLSEFEIEMENRRRKNKGKKRLTKKELKALTKTLGEFAIVDEGSTAERFQAVCDLVQSNECQLGVVDSMAAVVSQAREDTPLDEEPQQSAEARLVTEFQKMLHNAYNNPHSGSLNFTTVLMINQVRANRNKRGPFDREWKVGGAWILKHAKMVDLIMSPGERIYETPTGKITAKKAKGHTLIGKKVRWAIEKGKAGCHEGPSGEVPYYFAHGFDIYTDLIITAKATGIVTIRRKKDQPYFKVLDSAGEEIDSGEGDVEVLAERALWDDDFFWAVYNEIMWKEGVQWVHKL